MSRCPLCRSKEVLKKLLHYSVDSRDDNNARCLACNWQGFAFETYFTAILCESKSITGRFYYSDNALSNISKLSIGMVVQIPDGFTLDDQVISRSWVDNGSVYAQFKDTNFRFDGSGMRFCIPSRKWSGRNVEGELIVESVLEVSDFKFSIPNEESGS